ncbi:class III poly(R)-hydroxyalkanoic acid synthase subunit PhaE [Stenotrophomonas maltophilia]|uniref:class III poly(R)-hydroxyalkanoic acid synthase subunit PhaE n=1 Tax=Stenotrophomonas maltophilia TaxID=40324 RepID=UPI0006AA5487|nr:class III poly(R)-hydroxyalkanoic acid synthase subunit PhaE [Stenotrophomonas maltophilia]ALA83023.1 PHA synthase subunit [Stenotrophomonas maltophilia]MBH1480078.1 class III poly(R)-hydroxyalkanoic acid synthase subunit PhaE [Stenotrophomonas maltophilia]MBH1505360.1 class III poly(R)-hydroxyalkanoic acid synthase subunit PhaE [Stenotrophomonas maltophilia]MBH1785506.1 class III poly(R)-hydroxyalkanoic acid synthase subunit PhaE [Stenotrophomonas maltophilia]
MTSSAHDAGSSDFEALARQYFGAWGDALRHAATPGAPAGDGPGSWQRLFDEWGQLLPEQGPGAPEDAVRRFREQAGSWYGTMQDVAARFAGRDASSADVAQAWREAVQGQGDGMLQWMLQGARGSTHAGAAVPEFAAWLQQFQLQAGPWLQSPAFGPGREHQARWQALLRAQEEYQQHSRAYVEQIKQALDEAFALFEQRLAQHEQPGSQLTSARAMFDLWIEVAEEAYAKVAMSEPFQQVYASLGNAQMRLRAGLQREVEQMSERVGLPTRSEMDAAHRRIAELERSLRRLQAQVAVLAGTATVDPVAQPAPAKVKPAARKAAKKAAPANKAAPSKAPAKKVPARKAPAKKAAARTSSRTRDR